MPCDSRLQIAPTLTLAHEHQPHGRAVARLARDQSADNGSDDGSLEHLRELEHVSTLRLPLNFGHDLALDLGVLSCKSEYVVTLDVEMLVVRD